MILDQKLVAEFARGATRGQKAMVALADNMRAALGKAPDYATAQAARAEVIAALEKAGYSAPARAWSRLLTTAEITPLKKDGTPPQGRRGPKAAPVAGKKEAAPVAGKKEAAPMLTEAAWQAADARAVCAWLNKASRLTKAGQCDQLLIAAIRDLMAEFV